MKNPAILKELLLNMHPKSEITFEAQRSIIISATLTHMAITGSDWQTAVNVIYDHLPEKVYLTSLPSSFCEAYKQHQRRKNL